jgi:hypothetical protein
MMGQTTRQGRSASYQKLLAVVLTTFMIFSMFSGTVFFGSTPAAAAGNNNTQTPARFEISSVGNQNGDLSVTVEATNGASVSDFQFWYDDLDGGGTLGSVELTSPPSGAIK